MGNLSASEIVILLLIVLLVFGANRLPDAGKAVGKGLREFKRALTEAERSIQQLPPPPSTSSPAEGAREQPRNAKPKRLVE